MFNPQGPLGANDRDKKPGPSWQRKAVWIVCGLVGVYFVISGLVGLLSGGS